MVELSLNQVQQQWKNAAQAAPFVLGQSWDLQNAAKEVERIQKWFVSYDKTKVRVPDEFWDEYAEWPGLPALLAWILLIIFWALA